MDTNICGLNRVICKAESAEQNGKKVTITNGVLTWEATMANQKAVIDIPSIPAPAKKPYTITFDGYTKTINLGFGDCVEITLSDKYDMAIKSDITTLEGRISTDEGLISANESAISKNADDISALDGRLTTAEGSISAHSSNIQTITQDVSSLGLDVGSLETRMGTAEANISTNASNISAVNTKADSNANSIDSLNSLTNALRLNGDESGAVFQFASSGSQYGYKVGGTFHPFKTGAESFCYYLGTGNSWNIANICSSILSAYGVSINSHSLNTGNFLVCPNTYSTAANSSIATSVGNTDSAYAGATHTAPSLSYDGVTLNVTNATVTSTVTYRGATSTDSKSIPHDVFMIKRF